MPRQARVIVDQGIYYILARGNNGQPLFRHEADYQHYLKLLSYYLTSHGLRLYHYLLMPAHVHLVLSVAVGVMLSRAMRGLHLSYTWHYHKRYRSSGHLWQGRFRSMRLLDEHRSLYCGRSLEQHPVRLGLATTPDAYPWSSYHTYANGAQHPFLIQNPHYSTLGTAALERQERYRHLDRDIVLPHIPEAPLTRSPIQVTTPQNHALLDHVWMFPLTMRPRGRPRKVLTLAPRHITPPIDHAE